MLQTFCAVTIQVADCQSNADCNDGDACTTDTCDPGNPSASLGGCVHPAVTCDACQICDSGLRMHRRGLRPRRRRPPPRPRAPTETPTDTPTNSPGPTGTPVPPTAVNTPSATPTPTSTTTSTNAGVRMPGGTRGRLPRRGQVAAHPQERQRRSEGQADLEMAQRRADRL